MNLLLSHLLPKRSGIPVLMYHRIEEASDDSLTVTRTEFDAQLSFLKQEGYASISIAEFTAYLNGSLPRAKLPKKPVLITFDDGYASTLTQAAPLLEKHGLRASLFVTSEFIEKGETANPPYLTQAGLKEFTKRGHELALHSHSHPSYKNTPHAEILSDLKRNQEWFEKHGVPHVPVLAYPFGARPKNPVALQKLKSDLREMGVTAAFRIGNRIASWKLLDRAKSDAFDLPRIDIRGDDTLKSFRIKVQKGRIRPFQ